MAGPVPAGHPRRSNHRVGKIVIVRRACGHGAHTILPKRIAWSRRAFADRAAPNSHTRLRRRGRRKTDAPALSGPPPRLLSAKKMKQKSDAWLPTGALVPSVAASERERLARDLLRKSLVR